jgi:plasmid stabilization system protein ParE
MKVVVAAEAQTELREIWQWNVERWGVPHADSYLDFLDQQIYNLGTAAKNGKIVESQPRLRYLLIKRRRGGHGHIAVYYVAANEIVVAHVFYTAQNWQTKLVETV